MATTQTPARSSIFAHSRSQAGDTSSGQNEGTAAAAALSSPFNAHWEKSPDDQATILGYQSIACAPACRHLSHEELRVRAYETGWGPAKSPPTGVFARPGVWTAKLDIPLVASTARRSSNNGFFILPSQVPPPTAFTHAHCDVLIQAECTCRTQEENLRRLAQGACELLTGALKDTEAKYARVQLEIAAEKMRADRLERQVSDLKDAEVEHRKALDDARRECAAALGDSQDFRVKFTAQSEAMAGLREEREALVMERDTFSATVLALEAAADDAQTRFHDLSAAHSALRLKHDTLKRRTAALVIFSVSILLLFLSGSTSNRDDQPRFDTFPSIAITYKKCAPHRLCENNIILTAQSLTAIGSDLEEELAISSRVLSSPAESENR